MKTFKQFVEAFSYSDKSYQENLTKQREEQKKKKAAEQETTNNKLRALRAQGIIKGTHKGVSGTFHPDPSTGRNTRFVPDGQ